MKAKSAFVGVLVAVMLCVGFSAAAQKQETMITKQGLFEKENIAEASPVAMGAVPESPDPTLAFINDEYSVILVNYKLGKSSYATRDFPGCAPDHPDATTEFEKYLEAAGTVGSALTKVAGAAVAGYLTIGATITVSLISNSNGNLGAIGNWIKQQTKPSRAVCVSQFAVVPEDSIVTRVTFSNRNGAEGWVWPKGDKLSTKDWSGWRHFRITVRDGRQIVSATAVNWKHDKGTQQIMRIFLKKK